MKQKAIKKAKTSSFTTRRKVVYANRMKVYHQLTFLEKKSNSTSTKLTIDIKGQKKITDYVSVSMTPCTDLFSLTKD